MPVYIMLVADLIQTSDSGVGAVCNAPNNKKVLDG
jgi:hypothetical protein